MHHQLEEIGYQLAVSSQVQVGLDALELKTSEVLAIPAAHRLCHLLAKFDGWWVWLRVLSQDKSKIDMEDLSAVVDEEILEMTITQPEEISDRTVASTRQDVVIHDGIYDGLLVVKDEFLGHRWHMTAFLKELLVDGTVVVRQLVEILRKRRGLENILEGTCMRHEFDKAIRFAASQCFVRN